MPPRHGMFLFKASIYLHELQRYALKVYAACEQAWKKHIIEHDFIRQEAQAIAGSPVDSIAYAVMTHTDKAAVMPLTVHWNDMDSWKAFYK